MKLVSLCLAIVGLPAWAFAGDDPLPAKVFKDAVAVWQPGAAPSRQIEVHGNVRLRSRAFRR